MALELRYGEDEQDAVLIFKAYKEMHDEGLVPGAFNPVKTLKNVLRIIKGPKSCALLAMDGPDLVGVLSLLEEAYWWSDDTCLSDKGFYVVPQRRDGDGSALLLDEAARLSDAFGIPVFVTIFNGRRKRGAGSKWERVGATIGFSNRGAMIAHYPESQRP